MEEQEKSASTSAWEGVQKAGERLGVEGELRREEKAAATRREVRGGKFRFLNYSKSSLGRKGTLTKHNPDTVCNFYHENQSK